MTQERRQKTVAVLDYGSGNVHSAVKALEAAGAQVTLTADPESVLGADGLVVPGVGAFAAVMQSLKAAAGDRLIAERLAQHKPVLGICVGQQVLFESGTERGVAAQGLGLLRGRVERLQARVLPHMGWNTVVAPPESKLFAGITDASFYFVHSYGVCTDPEPLTKSLAAAATEAVWAQHEDTKFLAAVTAGCLTGVQFHPEKSGAAGLRLLGNWISGL